MKTAAPIVAAAARFNEATDENVRADLAALPGDARPGRRLDRRGRRSAASSSTPADFQIAPSLRLVMTLDDLRPLIEDRPAGELALRVVPDYPGDDAAGPARRLARAAAPEPRRAAAGPA